MQELLCAIPAYRTSGEQQIAILLDVNVECAGTSLAPHGSVRFCAALLQFGAG